MTSKSEIASDKNSMYLDYAIESTDQELTEERKTLAKGEQLNPCRWFP